jgi:hypothetical protein
MKSAVGNNCEQEVLKTIVECCKVDVSPQTNFTCELAK